MSVFSRALGRWDPIRVAAAVLAVAWLGLLAAFGYGYVALGVSPNTASIVAAAAVVAIAGGGFLYAWRVPGR